MKKPYYLSLYRFTEINTYLIQVEKNVIPKCAPSKILQWFQKWFLMVWHCAFQSLSTEKIFLKIQKKTTENSIADFYQEKITLATSTAAFK